MPAVKGLAIAHLPHCALAIVSDAAVGKGVRSPLLRSPGAGHIAWSLVFHDVDSASVSTHLIVRDQHRAQEKTIAVTQWKEDTALGIDPSLSRREHAFHAICPIDWSPDGQLLLFEETLAPMGSDAITTYYWIYHGSITHASTVCDGSTSILFTRLCVLAWRPTRSGTLSLLVLAHPEPADDKFFGYWKVRLDDLEPRLIESTSGGCANSEVRSAATVAQLRPIISW